MTEVAEATTDFHRLLDWHCFTRLSLIFEMSSLKRVQQWATFARAWHLYDATWQDPMVFSKTIVDVLSGKNKPIFHPGESPHRRLFVAVCVRVICHLSVLNWLYALHTTKFHSYPCSDNDCGDHVVIVNAAKIALYSDNWRYCHFYVDTRFPQQHYKIPYFHVHDKVC